MKIIYKKILFISPKFFNYENEIISILKKNNSQVFFFDERPSNNQLIKALIRIRSVIRFLFIYFYYLKILNKIKNINFNYFLLIKGEATPIFFLKKLRKKNPKAVFIYYTYDSITNNKKSELFFNFFEKKFSFEIDEYLKRYNFRHRPLFFLPDYEVISKKEVISEIDILFIASIHSDRFEVVNKIIKNINKKKSTTVFYTYFYLSGYLNFFYNKLFNKTFKDIKKSDLSFVPLKKNKVLELISKSKCIIDIEHPSQNGLTMRTIECIGANKKIITTNSNILQYDIYSSNNICVIDRNKPNIPISFLETSYIELNDDIYYKYSLQGWIEDVFN